MCIRDSLLSALRNGYSEYAWIIERFCEIGFRESEINGALEAFYKKKILSTSLTVMSRTGQIMLENNVLAGYWWLLEHPAYIDSMAIVTPIDVDKFNDKESEHSIRSTRYYELSDIVDRVCTSVNFVAQLQQDQNMICTWRNDDNRERVDPSTFSSVFSELAIKDIAGIAANALRKRYRNISGIREPETVVAVQSELEKLGTEFNTDHLVAFV